MTKKKHHYLPQFYVGGFLNKDREVYIFSKKDNSISKQGKNGTFHLRYFYTLDLDKYEKRSEKEIEKRKKALGIEKADMSIVDKYPDMLEDLLSESENSASIIIPKLINNEHIDSMDRIELATFMAFMYTRTPAFRKIVEGVEKRKTDNKIQKIFSSKESLKTAYNKMCEDGYDKEVDLDKLYDCVENNRYKIMIPRELGIQHMLYTTTIIDKILYKKTWLVVEACSESSFITTDVPILMAHSDRTLDKLRFDTPGVQVIFPLSRRAILIMQDTQHGSVVLNKKFNKSQMRDINKIITTNAGNYIIAKDKALLERIIKNLSLGTKKIFKT